MNKGGGQWRRTNGASRRLRLFRRFIRRRFIGLTYKGHVQQIIPIEHAAVEVGHRRAQAFDAVAAEVTAQIMKGQGERVHRVHDELNLGFLLVAARRRQPQLGRAQGEALIAGIGAPPAHMLTLHARYVPPQVAAEYFLPVLPKPRISPIVVGGERRHVLVEAGNVFRLQLDGDGALGLFLEALDQLALSTPAIAGQPLQRY